MERDTLIIHFSLFTSKTPLLCGYSPRGEFCCVRYVKIVFGFLCPNLPTSKNVCTLVVFMYMPVYLEILLVIALVFFIVWNVLFAVMAMVIIRGVNTVKAKTNETLDSIQVAAYTVSEKSGMLQFLSPLLGFFSPKKKSAAEVLFDAFRKSE